MIVLDASVVVDFLFGSSEVLSILRQRRAAAGHGLCAPHLLDAEVGQVLRKYVMRGELTDAQARECLELLSEMRIDRYPHGFLMERAFSLRHNLSFYDSLYLALAEALQAELLTRDAALASIPRTKLQVTIV